MVPFLTPELITPDWPAPSRVRSAITTRKGGISLPPWHSFNLGDHVGDKLEHVATNRARLREILKLDTDPCWLQQVHGTTVVELNGAADRDITADGAWSQTPGQVCAVMTADCLPVLLCNVQGTRVAAVHCGWRGLASGILRESLECLEQKSCDLMAYLGPAIGSVAFEIGEEVIQAFVDNSINSVHRSRLSMHFTPGAPGKAFADIYGLATEELRALGVRQIFGGGRCTFSEEETFFSYRRDGVTGRMVSLIWVDTGD